MNNFFEKQKKWLLDEKYQGKANEDFDKDLKRLASGEPLDYIIGFIMFLNCKIDLRYKPLIPRPETEFWVKEAIEEMKESGKKNIEILDLFSGSGCIGIALLKNIPNCSVCFADIDKNCLDQIKFNLKENQIDENRFKIIKSDVFSNIESKYDYIFANPPYIPDARKIQKSVSRYEPANALFGGTDGLKYIRIILKSFGNFLKEKGCLFLEIDSSHKKFFEEKKIKIFLDQYARPRYVKIKC
ncbi:HemK family protein methyltransferase [Candidatus Parcubacteria bacterium]|nr:HemK family protein methyltransferase [Candidatus Parcubacteria bacterium]HPM08226.1 HemK family protein methyltransferase [Candidatus Pacearchaeota archaeon]